LSGALHGGEAELKKFVRTICLETQRTQEDTPADDGTHAVALALWPPWKRAAHNHGRTDCGRPCLDALAPLPSAHPYSVLKYAQQRYESFLFLHWGEEEEA
jgi:hypothetical protein